MNETQKHIVLTLTFLLLGLIPQQAYSQDSTPDSKDSSSVVIHSPVRATVMSAILPGLGQAYNKKYWKIPIIYAGIAGIGYIIKFNNDSYKSSKNLYIAESELDTPNATSLSRYQAEALYYRRNRDLSIIGLLAFWGLNVIDANVDAHFMHFDISPDLSMNINPVYQLSKTGQLIPQLSFSMNF